MAAGENDVVTNVHVSATGINNGTAVTFTNIHGSSQTITPSGFGGMNIIQSSGDINAKLWNRFDDPDYYSA